MCCMVKVSGSTSHWFFPLRKRFWRRRPELILSARPGQLDDTAQDGLHVLREIMDIYRAYQFPTQVLAADLRHPLHVVEAAKMGVHIGAMPFKVFEQLFKHPVTDQGLASFLKDRERARPVLGEIVGTVPVH